MSTIGVFWFVTTIAIAFVAAWISGWFAHRYQIGEDADGYEIAVLGHATCDRCEHQLTPREVLPVRALRCPSCGERLPLSWSIHHLAVLAGSLAMLATWGPHVVLLPFLWMVAVLVTCATTDHRTMLIPKRVVWIGLAVGLVGIVGVSLAWGEPDLITHALIGSAAYFGFLLVAHLINPAGMGFGDVRLALLLGLYLGWIDIRLPLFGLLIGNLVYLAYALPQRIAKGRDNGRFSPFGPGLAIGTILAVCLQSVLV